MVTVTPQQQIPELTSNWYALAEANRAKANKNDADLADAVNSVAAAAVRKINGVSPNTAGEIELALGAKADPLTQAQIDALPGSGLTPGRIVLNSDTESLEVVGSDGIARAETMLLFGSGADGDVTISGTVTLTRDMYYRKLTVPSGAVLLPNGYRIHVSEVLTVDSGGAIRATLATGVPPRIAGHAVAPGGTGGTGGSGGTVSPSGSATQAPGGGQTSTLYSGISPAQLFLLLVAGVNPGGAGGVGGRGGSYNNFDQGSSGVSSSVGGSGGTGGGALLIFARRMEGSGVIESVGGPGSAGQNSTYSASGDTYRGAAAGGGGGGGGGGIFLFTHKGRKNTLTVRSVGGAGGAGGLAATTGAVAPGSVGNTGGSGPITELALAS